jgi:rare lipoprotein A (peptidoglycan hydrolase)
MKTVGSQAKTRAGAAVPTQHTCPSGRCARSQLSPKLQSSEDSLQMNSKPRLVSGLTFMKVKLLRALARCIAALAVGTALFSVSAASRQARTTNSRVQKGSAAFYSPTLEGHKTACGGRYVASELTTAHRSLPCGTRVRITNTKNGKSVEATVNDWGPISHYRIVDVSHAVAEKLDFVKQGTTTVKVEIVQ